MKQYTLKNKYIFSGDGLHTGHFAHVTLCPAPENTGIRFHRVDLGPDEFVDAVAANVSSTARSTTITNGHVTVRTIEHLLSALTGLGVDNALIEIDNAEVPILDGSARLFADEIVADGLQEQDAERKYVELDHEIEYRDKKSGSFIKIIPSDTLSYEVTIDFNSRVLGIQTASWTEGEDYATQVAPCRTFCFLHEVLPMLRLGLVKGGNVENAIVIVEKPVSDKKLRSIAKIFSQPVLEVTNKGYLSNLELRFDDECGRHKLLDLMGDLRLAGGFLKARVIAYKPGHSVNTKAAQLI